MPAADIGIVEDGHRQSDQQEQDKGNKKGSFPRHGSPSSRTIDYPYFSITYPEATEKTTIHIVFSTGG